MSLQGLRHFRIYATAVLALLVIAICARSTYSQNTFPTPSGNVGIGTTSPPRQLTISGTAQADLALVSADQGALVTDGFNLQQNGVNTYLINREAGNMSFWTNAIQQMTILSSGNVGIGMTNPVASLDVNASTAWSDGWSNNLRLSGSNYPALRFYSTGVGKAAMIGNNNDGGLWFGVNGTGDTFGSYGMVIQPSGYVGIGTTNPVASLDVNASTAWSAGWSNNLRLSGSNHPALRFYSTGVGKAAMIGNNNDGGLWFGVNGTGDTIGSYGMVIQPSGYVGIGTTSPAYTFQVAGSGAFGVQSATDGYAIFLNATDSAYTTIQQNSGDFRITQSYSSTGGYRPITIYNGGSERLRVDASGKVGIGNDNPQYTLDVTGTINSSTTITAANIVAKYQDVAEWVESSETLAAGTVVVLDSTKSNQVIASTAGYDTRVAGVISAQPGITLGEKGDNKVLVATTGRVKIKVDASKSPIHIGDLLVTSDIPGVAMKSEPVEFAGRKMHMPGTLIGKALEPLEKGKGEILVLLSLQ